MNVKTKYISLAITLLLALSFTASIPISAHSLTVCNYTYDPVTNVPPQQLTIAFGGTPVNPVTYCFDAGTYNTQITITASNVVLTGAPGTTASQVIIQPTTLTENAAALVTHSAPWIVAHKIAAIIAVYNAAGLSGVVIKNLDVDGTTASSAPVLSLAGDAAIYIGILFQDASGTISGNTVNNIFLTCTPVTNCAYAQSGDGVWVENNGVSSTVAILQNSVTNYQKDGITCREAGTTCTVSSNTVSFYAPYAPYIGPNGIEIAYSATGTISGNTVSGNVCTYYPNPPGAVAICGPDVLSATESQATGIITGMTIGTVTISGNTLTGNDIGIELLSDTATITVTSNTISGSTYQGVVVYDESQSVTNNTFSNEQVGIEAASNAGAAVTVTVSGNSFSGVTTPFATEIKNAGSTAKFVSPPTSSPSLTVPTISPYFSGIPEGQSDVTLTVTWAGGTLPYTVTLYYSSTSFCYSGSAQAVMAGNPVTSVQTTFTTFTVSPSTTTYYCATVTDNAAAHATMLSGVAEVSVGPAFTGPLTAPVINVAPLSIDAGQGATLATTAPFSGGTPTALGTYTCQWGQESPTASKFSKLGASFTQGCTTASLPTLSTGLLYITGTWSFELNVTDSSSPPVKVSSNVVTVTVQLGPEGVASNPLNGYVYVADAGSNHTSVINSVSNNIVTTIAVGTQPWGIAVGLANATYPDGLVYVTNYVDGTVSVINAWSNTVIRTITVGTGPEGIAVAVNPLIHRVYVANSGSNTVSVISTVTDKVIATVAVGSTPTNVAIGPTNTVFVTDYGSNTVSVIQPDFSSTLSFAVTNVPVGTGPWGVAVNPLTNYVYVTDSGSGNVWVLDGATYAKITTIAVGKTPEGIAIDATASPTPKAYVVNAGSGTVSVITLGTKPSVKPITTGIGSGPLGVALLTSSSLGYVTNNAGNTVSVINLTTGAVIATIVVS